MQRTFTLKSDSKEYPHVFGGVKIQITLPDQGKDEAETWENIQGFAGDHTNAYNIFVGGGAALAVQKNVKAVAGGKEVEALLKERREATEAGDEERAQEIWEQVIQMLVDAGSTVPKVTIREQSATSGKPSTAKKAVEKKIEEDRSKVSRSFANLSAEEKARRIANLREMGLDHLIPQDEAA